MNKYKKSIIVFISIYSLLVASNAWTATCPNSGSDWYCDTDVNGVDDVQDTHDAATEGDTIHFDSGSATWTSTLTISKAITLEGATTCTPSGTPGTSGYSVSCDSETTIINNTDSYLIIVDPSTPADDPSIDISGFVFDDNDDTGNNGIMVLSNTDATYNLTNIKVHHNKWINLGAGNDYILLDGEAWGVVDHNHFEGSGATTGYVWHLSGNGNTSWTKASTETFEMGTEYFLYLEDNYISGHAYLIDDSGNASRWVARYNTLNNQNKVNGSTFDAHGNTKNRGTIAFEIYENYQFDDTGYSNWSRFVNFRGGTGIIYNNEIAENSGKVYITYQEEDNETIENDESANVCIGENDPWPCCTGLGTGTCAGCNDPPVPGRDSIKNSYVWNNMNLSGSALIWAEEGDSCGSIVEDTDWWDDMTGNPGGAEPSSNFSYDIAASKPGICSIDDVYWETDNLDLYRCTETNVWTKVYEPYTYPHPLNSGEDNTAPDFDSAYIDAQGDNLYVTWSEAVTDGGLDGGEFNLDCSVGGDDIALTYASGDTTSTWVFSITGIVYQGETCNLDFDGGADEVEDAAGNDLADITDASVTNSSGVPQAATGATSTMNNAGTATMSNAGTTSFSN
jgi:hypothetical protein